MLAKSLLFLLVLITVLPFISCGKSHESGSSNENTTFTEDVDNVTKYKRKGLEGRAVTNVPPVDHVQSEITSQKFKETEELDK